MCHLFKFAHAESYLSPNNLYKKNIFFQDLFIFIIKVYFIMFRVRTEK